VNYHLQWQTRTVDCRSCYKPITSGDKAVRESYANYKGFRRMRFYHLVCFLQKLALWFEGNEYVPKARGRKPQIVPNGSHKLRNSLISKYSYWMRKKRQLILEDNLEGASKLDSKLTQVKDSMRVIGGVPKSWGR